MSDLAAEFTIAAIKAGNLTSEPAVIVEFYNALKSLLSENNGQAKDVPVSKVPVSNALKN